MKIFKLLPLLFLVSCNTGSLPQVETPSYNKPSSGAKTLYAKNDFTIKKEADLIKARDSLKGSKYYYDKNNKRWVWDLNGGIIDGKNQKGDGGQGENQESLFRAEIPLLVKNGFVRNNKNAATFYGENSGVEKITFTNIGEDAVATGRGGTGFSVISCQFINDREGDKSIQLNDGKNAVIKNNLIVSGITGVRVGESYNSSKDSAIAANNKFIGCDTAFNVAKITLKIEKPNTYEKVRKPFVSSMGAKIENADGKIEND